MIPVTIKKYGEWLTDMENFYDVLPEWFKQPKSRMAAYDAYHQAARLWNAEAATAITRCPECGAVSAADDTKQGQAHPAQGQAQGD